MIYFVVQHTKQPMVKIGFSANKQTMEKRLSSLQTSNPYKLYIEHVFDGTRTQEEQIHDLLKAHHVSGEWYEYNAAIKRFATTAAQIGIVSAIYEYKRTSTEQVIMLGHLAKVPCTISEKKIQGRFLDVENAMQYTSMSRRSLDYARTAGSLPFIKKGKKIVFDVLDLDAWMLSDKENKGVE